MSQSVFIEKEFIDKVLDAKPSPGKHQLEPLKSLAIEKKLPCAILEDSELLENEAEIHKTMGDLWYCLEGEVEFTYGGELADSWVREGSNGCEIAGKSIRGGAVQRLTTGDWLWIPAGEPHTHRTDVTARLMIIKIPQI